MKQTKRGQLNWRKLRGMGSLGAMGFLLLFQYQNCAPSQVQTSANANDDSIVTIIDDVNYSAPRVSFGQEKVALVTDDQPTVVIGTCDSVKQDGSILGWRVHDTNGDEHERGYAMCEHGQFVVEMAPSSGLQCDQAYQLSASFADGTQAAIEFKRDCQNEVASR